MRTGGDTCSHHVYRESIIQISLLFKLVGVYREDLHPSARTTYPSLSARSTHAPNTVCQPTQCQAQTVTMMEVKDRKVKEGETSQVQLSQSDVGVHVAGDVDGEFIYQDNAAQVLMWQRHMYMLESLHAVWKP
jgi:hypothetical protein